MLVGGVGATTMEREILRSTLRHYPFHDVFRRRIYNPSTGLWTTDVHDFTVTAAADSSVRLHPPVIYYGSGTGANRLFYMGENLGAVAALLGSFDIFRRTTGGPTIDNSWAAPLFVSCWCDFATAVLFDQNNLIGMLYGDPWNGAVPTAPFPANPVEPFIFLGIRTDTDQYVLIWAKGDGSARQRLDLSTNAPGNPSNTNKLAFLHQPGAFIQPYANGQALARVTTNLPETAFGNPTRGAGIFASSGGVVNSRQDGQWWGLSACHFGF